MECPRHGVEMRVIADQNGTRKECDQCERESAEKELALKIKPRPEQ